LNKEEIPMKPKKEKWTKYECMLTLHWLLRDDDDDDTSERGIGNVLNKDNHVWSYKVWNGG